VFSLAGGFDGGTPGCGERTSTCRRASSNLPRSVYLEASLSLMRNTLDYVCRFAKPSSIRCPTLGSADLLRRGCRIVHLQYPQSVVFPGGWRRHAPTYAEVSCLSLSKSRCSAHGRPAAAVAATGHAPRGWLLRYCCGRRPPPRPPQTVWGRRRRLCSWRPPSMMPARG